MPSVPTTAGAVAAPSGPVAYVLIATFGLSLGWVVSRLLSGAREPREFLAPPRVTDRVADILASRFAAQILPDEPTSEDLERVAKNGLAAAGLMAVLALIVASMTANAFTPVVVTGCVVVVLLELGEVLVAYGVSEKPILFTEP
ncbi:hypothetical protein [Halogeometricum borinquense]|uniref:hypothetical protein n=1 Tax=Halogeometricum borinquense TaxID=60847 RepID=UPI00342D8919